MLLRMLLIFVGAGLGGVLRYVLGNAVQSASGTAFPVGTLAVNVSGCFAIGVLAAVFRDAWAVRDDVQVALLIGVLGGYTTFSAFGRETVALLEARRWALALANVALSNVLGLAAVWLGASVARLCTRS